MSTERRGDAPSIERTRTRRLPGSDDASPSVTSTQVRVTDSRPTELPLSVRIERTRLRIRISALERALERSERRQQQIVDRYEQLLADRDGSSDDRSTDETGSGSVLSRLLDVRS